MWQATRIKPLVIIKQVVTTLPFVVPQGVMRWTNRLVRLLGSTWEGRSAIAGLIFNQRVRAQATAMLPRIINAVCGYAHAWAGDEVNSNCPPLPFLSSGSCRRSALKAESGAAIRLGYKGD
jgi:hypothetical protein